MATSGLVPASSLGTISGTNRQVLRILVPQTDALRQAFQARFGKGLTITDGYRPYADQERIFRQRYTRTYSSSVNISTSRYKVWNGVRWYQRKGVAMAAVPGTSNHGWGRAIDFGSGVNVKDSAEHKWMVANAPRFGWHWPSTWARAAGEWWHFEASATATPVSNYKQVLIDLGVTSPGTLPPPLEESMSAAEVQQIKDYIDLRLNTKGPVVGGKQGTIAETLLGVHSRIQIRNPVKDEIVTVAFALTSTWDYAIKAYSYALKAYVEAAAARAAAESPGAEVDVAQIAAALAPMLVEAVVDGVSQQTEALSYEETVAAAEAAMRALLGSLGEAPE